MKSAKPTRVHRDGALQTDDTALEIDVPHWDIVEPLSFEHLARQIRAQGVVDVAAAVLGEEVTT